MSKREKTADLVAKMKAALRRQRTIEEKAKEKP
ncbi:hypothetical protein ES708_06182 [subsurface metagenome]